MRLTLSLEAWRLPYGDSGILAFFLEELAKDGISNKLKIQSLRIVGNACADTNKNRALMVEGNRLEAVIRQLSDESVVQFTIPVLYNVMVDYGMWLHHCVWFRHHLESMAY